MNKSEVWQYMGEGAIKTVDYLVQKHDQLVFSSSETKEKV